MSLRGSLLRFIVFSFACWPLLPSPCLGQKVEIEKRIKEQDFPERAAYFLRDSFGMPERVKYYRERSSNAITYEAKFRKNEQMYSVEFFEDGGLMDIEVEMDYNEIPAGVRKVIEDRWEQDFRKSKIKRVQRQLSDSGKRYEIIVRGKTNRHTDFYEYLFEANGQFVTRQRIIKRVSDLNLY